jgi:hypothetical protein
MTLQQALGPHHPSARLREIGRLSPQLVSATTVDRAGPGDLDDRPDDSKEALHRAFESVPRLLSFPALTGQGGSRLRSRQGELSQPEFGLP